jgi:hypothetical protein
MDRIVCLSGRAAIMIFHGGRPHAHRHRPALAALALADREPSGCATSAQDRLAAPLEVSRKQEKLSHRRQPLAMGTHPSRYAPK